jgi:hypothetical protein
VKRCVDVIGNIRQGRILMFEHESFEPCKTKRFPMLKGGFPFWPHSESPSWDGDEKKSSKLKFREAREG